MAAAAEKTYGDYARDISNTTDLKERILIYNIVASKTKNFTKTGISELWNSSSIKTIKRLGEEAIESWSKTKTIFVSSYKPDSKIGPSQVADTIAGGPKTPEQPSPAALAPQVDYYFSKAGRWEPIVRVPLAPRLSITPTERLDLMKESETASSTDPSQTYFVNDFKPGGYDPKTVIYVKSPKKVTRDDQIDIVPSATKHPSAAATTATGKAAAPVEPPCCPICFLDISPEDAIGVPRGKEGTKELYNINAFTTSSLMMIGDWDKDTTDNPQDINRAPLSSATLQTIAKYYGITLSEFTQLFSGKLKEIARRIDPSQAGFATKLNAIRIREFIRLIENKLKIMRLEKNKSAEMQSLEQKITEHLEKLKAYIQPLQIDKLKEDELKIYEEYAVTKT